MDGEKSPLHLDIKFRLDQHTGMCFFFRIKNRRVLCEIYMGCFIRREKKNETGIE